jgi:cytochrome c oxidase assembly protein subunit 15
MSAFQRLAVWTTATTYVLILVGGLVRASGAGLGCPDWPRCFGSWIPPASAAELPAPFDASQFNPTLMWTEYLNRVLGVSVGFLIFATLVSAVRHHRRVPGILWPTVAAFLLTGFQGWLGGRVVAHELAAWIVTVHLIVALVIVSLLLYATLFAFYRVDGRGAVSPLAGAAPAGRRLAWATLALMAVTLGQVTLGAQVRGRVDEALDRGTPRADALSTVGAYDRWHRDAAAVVVGGTLIVVLLVLSQPTMPRPVARAAYVTGGLVGLQVAVGLSMAYVALTPPLQVAHLTASSLVLGSQTVLFLLARWLR